MPREGALASLVPRADSAAAPTFRAAERPPLWPREECQLACYEEGGFYMPHEDEEVEPEAADEAADQRLARRWTAVYFATEAHAAWRRGATLVRGTRGAEVGAARSSGRQGARRAPLAAGG